MSSTIETPYFGLIPATWKTSRFKYCFDLGKGLSITKADLIDEGIPVISYGQIHSKTNSGTHLSSSLLRFIPKSVTKRSALLNNGDIVFADTSEDYSGIGNAVFVDCDKTVYAGYHTIWARGKNQCILPKYGAYLFLTDEWRNQIRLNSFGVKVYSITQNLLVSTVVLVPPLAVQEHIISFLDKKCSEIDSLSSDIQKEIETLEAYKDSIISVSTTRGLSGSELKPSGIRWCPQIPYNWNRVPSKTLFKLRQQKALPGDKQLTSSQKHGILYQEDFMRLENQQVVLVDKDFSILKHVEPGDFVISMRSFQGGLEYSELRGSISSAYVMLIPDRTQIYPPFYRWFFKSKKYINALQSTSNLVRDGQAMRFSNFAQIDLFDIPLHEQQEIAKYLDSKCSEIDSIISSKKQQIEALTSYKKSLIYEYVTGKREVL